MPVVYLPRPQEVVTGNFPGKDYFLVNKVTKSFILGSEIWRLVQTIENVKASINSLINGPGYSSYFNQYLQKTQRVSFYRLETIQSKLTKLNDEFETNKLKLLDELKKVGASYNSCFSCRLQVDLTDW